MSILNLCDMEMMVLFTKSRCVVFMKNDNALSSKVLENVIYILWISLRAPQLSLVCLQRLQRVGYGTKGLAMQVQETCRLC